MLKYEIKTDNFEFRFGTSKRTIPERSANDVFGEYLVGKCNDPRIEESFDTLKEAQDEFCKNYAGYGRTHAEKGNTFWFLRGEVAWIEENEYNEDGEFDQGGMTYDFSAEGYKPNED